MNYMNLLDNLVWNYRTNQLLPNWVSFVLGCSDWLMRIGLNNAVSLAASTFLFLNTALSVLIKLPPFDWWWRSHCLSFLKDLCVQLLACTRKDLFYILSRAGTSLKALVNTLTLCKLHCSIESDLSLFFKLALVADEVHTHILSSMLLDLFQPTPQVVECLVTSNVISKEHTVSSTVEDSCHGFEWLLSSLKARG